MYQFTKEGEQNTNFEFNLIAQQQLNKKCKNGRKGHCEKFNSITRSLHFFTADVNLFQSEMQQPLLSIIKPHQCQRQHQELQNVLTALQDNQQNLPGGKYLIKSFLSTTKCQPAEYDKFQTLSKLLEPKWIDLYNELQFANHYLLKQLFDLTKMQFDQITKNALIFESPPLNSQQNNAFAMAGFYAKYEQSKLGLGKNSKQKILFLNLSGKTNLDHEVFKSFFGQTQQCLYIALQEIDIKSEYLIQRGGQFRILQFFRSNKYSKINWKQFKQIFKAEMKRDIQLFKPTLCILSIGKCFEKQPQDYLSFDHDCLQKILKLATKIANDKLIIHIQIQKYESAKPTEMQDESESSEEICLEKSQRSELFEYINSIQQGVLDQEGKGIRVFKCIDETFNQWLLMFIEKFRPYIPQQALQIYMRDFQNLQTIQKPFINFHDKLQGTPIILHSPYQDFKQYQPAIVQITYNDAPLYVSEKILLNIDYEDKILALFDIQARFLYFGKLSDKTYQERKIECNCVDLSQALKDQENLNSVSMAIKKYLIILLPLQNQTILTVNYETLQILLPTHYQFPVEQKKTIKNKVLYVQQDIQNLTQFRSRPGIVKNSIDSQFDLMLIGGEFLDQHKVCNIIELLKIDCSTGNCASTSVILKKEILLEKNNFKPYPHMLILENNYQPFIFVFLPGDYDNKENKYKQVINSEHSTYAMVLSVQIDNYKYSWERYEIYEEKSIDGEKSVPITEFTHQQHNIQYLGGLKWNIAMTKFEPKPFGLKSNSAKIYIPDKNQFLQQHEMDGNFSVVTRILELELARRMDAGKTINSLIIRQKSYQIGNTMDLSKQYWQPKPDQTT